MARTQHCCSVAASNLRQFVQTRPPLVIFVANLTFFAVALMFLSYWVQYNDLRNPDVTKDWNKFLERFASMEICLTGNKSHPFINRLSAFTIDGNNAIDLPKPSVADSKVPAVHYMTLDFELKPELLGNYKILLGAISGRLLGFYDRTMSYQLINITAVLPKRLKARRIEKLCVQMIGPANIFPKTKHPSTCSSPLFKQLTHHIAHGVNPTETSGLRASYMYIYKTVYWSNMFSCGSAMPKLKLKYKHDDRLTEMLSTEEKYVAEENLSHTAYAIVIIIAAILLYAIFGNSANSNNNNNINGDGNSADDGSLLNSSTITIGNAAFGSDSFHYVRVRNSASEHQCEQQQHHHHHHQQHLHETDEKRSATRKMSSAD